MTEAEDWTSPVEGSLDRVTFDDGCLDEGVGSRRAHLERLGRSRWFLVIGHDDGTETAIWFKSKDLKKPFYERRAPRATAIRQGEPGKR